MSEPPLILHIDDEQAIRDIVADTLQPAGFRVVGVERLVDGIQKALISKPDLILLDLNMPEGDGFEACAALRALPELSNVPVVMLTGMRDPDHRKKAQRLGAMEILNKPFEPKELVAAIRRVIAERKG